MAEYIPPKINTAFIFYCALTSQADTKLLQVNPTIATGDVKVEVDGTALGNITTLPTAVPASGTTVKVQLSAAEMNGDNIMVRFSDAAGAEWCDLSIEIQTGARQIIDLAYPTTSGRSLDVTATGEAGIDWNNIGAPTTTVALSGTTVKTATDIATQVTAAFTTDIIPDLVAVDGTRPTVQQALLMITRFLTERAVSGLTMTVKKEDGTTGSMTFTLNDAVNPTAITRAS